MTKKEELINYYENEILKLIDEQDDYPRGDLQGIVYCLVVNMLKAGKLEF